MCRDVAHGVCTGNGDDPPAGALEEWEGQLDHQYEVADRDGKSLVDLVHLQSQQRTEGGRRSIGHEEVEPLLPVERIFEGVADALLVGEVHLHRPRPWGVR
jgi:hypothetical protein